MNLHEKIKELVRITTALQNEVDEMKDNDTNTKLDELELEQETLKEDIIDLRHTLIHQNEKILSLIRQQNEKLVETIETDKLAPNFLFKSKVTKHARMFPIKSMKELDEVERYITEGNLNELLTIVHQLLSPQGVKKNLGAVLAPECVVDCNVDGYHSKKRLLDYPKFMDLVFQAVYYDGYSQKSYLDDFRRGLKKVKNRYYKNAFMSRQMLQQSQGQELDYEEYESQDIEGDEEEEEYDINHLQEDFIKTETLDEYAKMFPIKSIKDVEEMESFITEKNLSDMIIIIQQLLLPQGVLKNMDAILSTECILECNVDGLQNKKRLLDYTKFMDLLYQSAFYEGYSYKTFLDEVRRGLKAVKNRHYKNVFKSRQQLQSQEQDHDYDDMDTSQEHLEKIEEIFCD